METNRFQELYVQLEKGGKFTPCYLHLDAGARNLTCFSRATALYKTSSEILITFNTSCISLVKHSSDAPKDCHGHRLYCFEIVYYQKTTKFAATAWSIMEEWIASIKSQSVQQTDTSLPSDRMSMIGGYKAEIIGGNLIKTPLQSHSKPRRPKNKLVINPTPLQRPKITSTKHVSDPDLFAVPNTTNFVPRFSSTNSLNQHNYANSNGHARLSRNASDAAAGPQPYRFYQSSPLIDTSFSSDTPRPPSDTSRSNGHGETLSGGRFIPRVSDSSTSSKLSDRDLSSLTSPSLLTECSSTSLKGLPVSPANVLKAGYCVKQSSLTKRWKRLYMVLGDQGLCYYKNDMMKKLIKRIWPKEVEEVRRSDSKITVDRDNLMELHTREKKYFMQFDSPEELNEWIYVIRSHVGLSLVTYI